MDSDLKLEGKWNEVPEIERSASISVRDEPLRLFALTPPTHDNNYCMFWQAFSRTQKPVEREAKKDYYIYYYYCYHCQGARTITVRLMRFAQKNALFFSRNFRKQIDRQFALLSNPTAHVSTPFTPQSPTPSRFGLPSTNIFRSE